MEHHPDHGGTADTMSAILSEYAEWELWLETFHAEDTPTTAHTENEQFFDTAFDSETTESCIEEQNEVIEETQRKKPRVSFHTNDYTNQTPFPDTHNPATTKASGFDHLKQFAGSMKQIGRLGKALYKEFKPEIEPLLHNAARKTADKVVHKAAERFGTQAASALGESLHTVISETFSHKKSHHE